jgi:glycosyltransferase involved in cell wall biosynthesis
MNRLNSLSLRKVARVIAVSQAVKRTLIEQRVFFSEQISVVLNGIDFKRFAGTQQDRARKSLCHRLGLSPECLLVGTVGEITKLKGHDDFVRAAGLIKSRVKSAEFIIAGQDHEPKQEAERALRRAITAAGLEKSVHRFGWVEDLAELYGALDVFVSASHSESFGLVLAEAMAVGTPVVATKTEGACEIIQDGINGKLTPIGDAEELASAVSELLEHPDTRLEFAARGRDRIREQFGVERMLDQTEEIYNEILRHRRV